MNAAKKIIDAIFILIIVIVISMVSINIKRPYPRKIIELFSEPYVRFFSFLLILALTYYNHTISILFMFAILIVNIDLIHLVYTSGKNV